MMSALLDLCSSSVQKASGLIEMPMKCKNVWKGQYIIYITIKNSEMQTLVLSTRRLAPIK